VLFVHIAALNNFEADVDKSQQWVVGDWQ